MGISRRAQHNLLGDGLNRCRKVHLLLGDHALRLTRRASKKHVELVRRHGQTLAIVEIRHVQSDRAVLLHIHDVFENRINVLRLAIWGKPHQLVLS